MYTTKLTVEITVETHFGPSDAIRLVDIATRMPAITSVDIIGLKTDYVLPENAYPANVELKAIQSIPWKIR